MNTQKLERCYKLATCSMLKIENVMNDESVWRIQTCYGSKILGIFLDVEDMYGFLVEYSEDFVKRNWKMYLQLEEQYDISFE